MMMTTTMKSFLLAALLSPMATTAIAPIHGYIPDTHVSHVMSLSWDFQIMKRLLEDKRYDEARKVYEEGGNSYTTAFVKLDEDIPDNIKGQARLYGVTQDGKPVEGILIKHLQSGHRHITFLYPAYLEETTQAYPCRIGGLPDEYIETEGCLVPEGELTTEDGSQKIKYSYDVNNDHENGQTLAGLSNRDNKRMRPDGGGDYFGSFQAYADYYGRYDYADEIITAAFEAKDTDLERDNFHMADKENDHGARTAVIRDGTSILSVGMNVLRELEFAVSQCEVCVDHTNEHCEAEDAPEHAVDRAVAFYHGATDEFFHNHANLRCNQFGTCRESDNEALVNVKVIDLFQKTLAHVLAHECQGARHQVDMITNLMWVPLVQGTLRWGWLLAGDNVNNQITASGHQASGAIYAASLLPLMYECSQEAGQALHSQMRVRDFDITVDYATLKGALESCYDFLGITCEDVGGVIDPDTGKYADPLTAACVTEVESDSKKGSAGKVFGLLLLFLVLIAGGVFGYMYYKKKSASAAADAPKSPDTPEQPLPKTTQAEVV